MNGLFVIFRRISCSALYVIYFHDFMNLCLQMFVCMYMFDIMSTILHIHIFAHNTIYLRKALFYKYLIYFCIWYDFYNIILMITVAKITYKILRNFPLFHSRSTCHLLLHMPCLQGVKLIAWRLAGSPGLIRRPGKQEAGRQAAF